MRPLGSQAVRWSDARRRALVHARECGDDLVRAAAAVRAGEESAARLVDALEARQRPDGGMATLPGVPQGELARACRALSLLDDAASLHAPLVERLVAHLAALRRDDGAFADEACVDEERRIVATGMLTGFLAKTRCARGSLLAGAAHWLAERFSPERVQGFAWSTIAAYAHTFATLPHDDSDGIMQWCGRELERGFRARAWGAVRTARVLAWCGAPVFPGARLSREELLAGLVAEQGADGGFGPADAPACERASQALDAAVGLDLLAPPRPSAFLAGGELR